tara:strand:- start:270 stop:401 length:132 start_codon:yes stop_codon:yes gene_type:complete
MGAVMNGLWIARLLDCQIARLCDCCGALVQLLVVVVVLLVTWY